MSLWKFKMADVEKEISGGDYISKSGCYNCIIEKVEVYSATDASFSTALNLFVKTADEEKARIPIWIKNKKGEDVDFNIKHMNQFCFLTRIKPEDMTEVEMDKKTTIPVLKDVRIGIFLGYKHEDGEKYANYDLKGFYNPDTKKTAFETNKQIEAKKYAEMEKMFEKDNTKAATEKPRNTKNNNGLAYTTDKNIVNESQMENDDEFPF